MKGTLVMILAGGKGSRLGPLTCHRAKPAVPFAGRYRIIDFVLSNLVNSGYRQVYMLTQYMASSLIRHLSRNWHLSSINEYIEVVPAQMRRGAHWYLGTADAVCQNLNLVHDSRCEHIAVFGGDHVYKFDVSKMDRAHRDSGADLTIAAIPVPLAEASAFGVIQVNADGRITGFQEKPANPTPMPGRPGYALVSMGNYLFRRAALVESLLEDARDSGSSHDFGKDVIPTLLKGGADLRVYDFSTSPLPGEPTGVAPYWRDVGTIDSYIAANMEVRSPLPALNLYNRRWRVRTAQRDFPPARFVQHLGQEKPDVQDALVAEGSIVVSAALHQVILGYDCYIRPRAHVERSVILSGCDVGEDAIVRNAVLDKNCFIEAGARMGLDPEEDRARFPFISEGGAIVLPKGTRVPKRGPIELAADMYELLATDPATIEQMEAHAGRLAISDRRRHSYWSAGPWPRERL
jgi:glucose-1-phosphate adenylyltransferase